MNNYKSIRFLSLLTICILGFASCSKKDEGAYRYQNRVNVYNGNVYDYLLQNKNGQFDSLMIALDRVTWLKDSLKNSKAITVFGLTNRSFALALNNLNLIRKSQNRTSLSMISINKQELDTLLDRYVVTKKLSTDNLKFADGAFLRTVEYDYEMNAVDKSSNASGLVNGGPMSVLYSDVKRSQYTKDWKSTSTQAVNIFTTNAVLHIISSTHEFGFAEFSIRMNK